MASETNNAQQPSELDLKRPWWRYPIVWLVVGGPAAVVVASLYTVGIAVRNVDPVLDTSPKTGVELKDQPAERARNHALDVSRQPADR
jgi:hypothetical protein